MSSDHTKTILRAAASIMRSDALERVHAGKAVDESEAVSTALLAAIAVEKYLAALDDLERPF